MKVLVLYDYPPSPGELATQGNLLYRGSKNAGVDTQPAHFELPQEKEWYYRWFEPDVVVGIGYWGYTPHIELHPQRYGVTAVPWLAAGKMCIAEKNLMALAGAVKMAENPQLIFGFNEYLSAQDGQTRGQDWQTWSAAMFIYAAECVERGRTPFFLKNSSGCVTRILSHHL